MPTTVIGQGINAVLALGFILVVSRWLGPSGKGLHAMFSAAAQMASVVLGFGYTGAVPFAVRGDSARVARVVRTQGRLLVLAIVVCGALALLNRWYPIWPDFFGAELAVTLLVAALIGQMFVSSLALSVGDAFGSVGASIIGTVLSIAGVAGDRWLTGGITVVGVIQCQALALAAGAIWAGVRVSMGSRRDVKRSLDVAVEAVGPSSHHLERAVAMASVLGLTSNVASVAALRGDVFFVDHFSGASVAGVYSLAVFLGEIGAKIPQWTAGALTSVVAADVRAGIDRTLGLAVAALVTGTIGFVVVLVFQPLLSTGLTIIAGPSYAGTLPLIIALAPRVILQAALALIAGNLAAHGYTRFHTGGAILGLVVMVVVDMVLVRRAGAYGAAIGSFASIAASTVVMVFGFARVNGLRLAELPVRSASAFRGQAQAALRILTRWAV